MRGVQFGEYHTADDWGLILNSKKIDPPAPKYSKVEVDGRDGEINLSRALTGEIKYSNRDATFTFLITEGTQSEREDRINEIINLIHGQELQIIEPDDPDHYLFGECSVSNVSNTKAYGSFTVTVDCEPYRYSVNEVNRVITATSTPTDIILTNTGRRTLTPTLTVSNSVNLVIGTNKVALSAGIYKLTALILKTGTTIVTVSGTGTVAFSYREAVL